MIEGLAAMRSVASVTYDSDDTPDDPQFYRELRRGVEYVDALRAWFESRETTSPGTVAWDTAPARRQVEELASARDVLREKA